MNIKVPKWIRKKVKEDVIRLELEKSRYIKVGWGEMNKQREVLG